MSKVKTGSSEDKGHKVVAKKSSSSSSKKEKKHGILSNAPESHYFILCNGQQVKNVKELADALETLDDEVFNHHVTFDRNDFANWINDIFKDAELAAALAGVKDKKDTRIVMYKQLIKCLNK